MSAHVCPGICGLHGMSPACSPCRGINAPDRVSAIDLNLQFWLHLNKPSLGGAFLLQPQKASVGCDYFHTAPVDEIPGIADFDVQSLELRPVLDRLP